MVHGLTAQLAGGMILESAPGLGTSIALWLPVSTIVTGQDAEIASAPDRPVGRGNALLVDDDDLVRMSIADMLQDLGFDVLEVASGEKALQLVQSGECFDLLVTDHLMPGIKGSDLATEARRHISGLPVLIVSGYAEVDGISPNLPRLTKPFRNDELTAALSEILPDNHTSSI